MAKAKESPKNETKEAKAAKAASKEDVKTETKAVAKHTDLNALAAKAAAAKAADSAVRSQDGVNVQYISLCQSLSKALDDENELYIDGLKVKDFYCQSLKKRFGPRLRVVPLAFLTVYTEYSESGQAGKFLGVWHKDDALQFPLVPGHFFNREMPNDHELRPAHWVMCYLPDFPDIERAVITFKSTGNKVAKAWAKDVDTNGGASCQQLYELTGKSVSNDYGKWFEVTPEFQGFVYEQKGDKFIVNEDFAEEVIEKSLELNDSYTKGTLVPRRAAGAMRPAIGGRSADSDDEADYDEDDDDGPTF